MQKIVKNVSNGLQSSVTEYLSGFQYRQANMGRRISPSVPVLMYFPTAEGYVNWLAGQPKYVYNYTDHLGNVRLSYTFDEENNMLKIMEENHYYPFGLKHQNYNSEMLDYTIEDNEVALQTFANQIGDGKYNYKYNGKEYQEELGLNWSDYGARNYDAALGRWMNIDPLAEMYRRHTPYAYAVNNPIYFLDPDGMKVINGDEAARDKAKEERDKTQSDFNKNYSSSNLKKEDFKTKEEWKAYKTAKNDLNNKQKSFDKAESNYQHTQNSIDNFADVDPESFAKVDNLTYKNKAGETKSVDIIVTTGDTPGFDGGVTSYAPTTAGDITGDVIETSISASVSIDANVLAHEFGHSIDIASDPLGYYDAIIPNHNCQDPANRFHKLSKTAMDWQNTYDKNYKDYLKKKSKQ